MSSKIVDLASISLPLCCDYLNKWKVKRAPGSLERPVLAHIILPGTPRPANQKKNRYGQIYNVRRDLIKNAKWEVKAQYRGAIIDHAVYADYYFGMPIPKTWKKEKQEEAAQGNIPHITTPDFDNLKKTYNDVIKGIVIEDDRLIRGGFRWKKEYDLTPRVEIWIYDGR